MQEMGPQSWELATLFACVGAGQMTQGSYDWILTGSAVSGYALYLGKHMISRDMISRDVDQILAGF